MRTFRISKYDNRFRENGIYEKSEWTSVSDIGKTFDGVEFCATEYERIENRYLLFIAHLCTILCIERMQIVGYEDYFGHCSYCEGQTLKSISHICDVAKDCLREKCWCKLVSSKLCIRFGYDYYLYVSSSLDSENMGRIVQKFHLYMENV